jgi:hypothetical protein
MQQQQRQQCAASAERQDQGASRFHQHPDPAAAASFKQQQRRAANGSSNGEQPCASSQIRLNYSKHRSAATIRRLYAEQRGRLVVLQAKSQLQETIIARRRQHICVGD